MKLVEVLTTLSGRARGSVASILVGAWLVGHPQSYAADLIPKPLPGWRMELLLSAPQVRHPSVVCTAPDGRIFVAEDPMDISAPRADLAHGRILCLHTNGSITVFATNLYAVFGMQFLEGKLFVLHNPKFSVFRDDNGVGRERADLIEQTHPNPWALDWNDHVPANFRLAMDGFFYIAVGDKGLFGAVDRNGKRVDLHGGGVVRIRPDGTGLEVFSRGTRNILNVAMTSEDEMFTYDNTDEHEWMGRLTHMVDGGFYGYPFDFIPRRPYTLWMLADYGPGAACGALAYTDDALPSEFRDNLFLADFGQRNIRRVILERAAGTFRAARDQLLFPDPPPDFRPVGIHETADGRGLLVCDWQHLDNKENVTVGRLWRLTHEGATNAVPKPDWFLRAALGQKSSATDQQLIDALDHPARRVRLTAQRELQQRLKAEGWGTIQSSLLSVLSDKGAAPLARIHALWALAPEHHDAAVPASALRPAMTLIDDPNPAVARQALRWLGHHQLATAAPQIAQRLSSGDGSIRFHAATALGKIAATNEVGAMLNALAAAPSELWPRFAAFTALNRIGRARPEVWPHIVNGLDHTNATVREAVGFALRDTFDQPLVNALAQFASDRARPSGARESAFRLLADVHHQTPAWKGEWWAYHPFRLNPPAKTVEWSGTALVLSALRTALSDAETNVQLAAIAGVQLARDLPAIPRLRALTLENVPTAIRASAIRALGDLSDGDTAAVITEILRNENAEPEIRDAALEAAGQLASEDLPLLTEALLNIAASDTAAERDRLGAINAIGRAKLTNAVAELVKAARSSSGPLRNAAVRALAGLGANAASAPLSELAGTAPTATRREAIAALAALRQDSSLPLLLDAARDAETRDAALAALTVMPKVEAVPAYLDALGSSDVLLREKARRALRDVRDKALPVIEARSETLTPTVRAELRRVYEGRSNVLAKAFLSDGVATLAPEAYAKYALTNRGDAWRGQRVFFDEQRVACIRCHAVHGWGGGVGPELTTGGAQFDRIALIDAVLNPGKAVREGYQQVQIELRNGETLSGIVKAENATIVTLLDAEGRAREIPRAEISSRRNSALSLMPEGLHAVLSLDEFADLVAYLELLKTDPRRAIPVSPSEGFEPLPNDLSAWHSVEGRDPKRNSARPPKNWTLTNGVFEHDGRGHHLWSEREFGDFVLRFDWRWVDAPKWEDHPLIGTDGREARTSTGDVLRERVLDSGDSGVFFRGLFAAQANLFCYPVGSGEFWELREAATNDTKRTFTPRVRADRPLGQWNRMELTVRGDSVTVVLNGEEVIGNARILGLPAHGPIGFQHEHGRLQIANVSVREL